MSSSFPESSVSAGPVEADASREAEAAAPRGRRWTRWIWTVLQVAVTAALLVWIFHDAELRTQMGRTLRRAEIGWLLVGTGLGAVWLVTAAYRWQIFLRVQGVRFEFWRTGCIYLIAQFFTLFLPGAVSGDAVCVVYLFRERPKQKTAVLLSVMMDHLAGLLTMMVTAVAIIWWRADWFARSPITEGTMYGLVIFLVGSVLGLAISLLMTQTRFVYWIPKIFPFRKQMIDFAHAFGLFLREWRWSLRGVGVSFVMLYAYFGTFYCASRAFGASTTLADIYSIMPIVDALTALPVTVSGLGVREKLFETMLRPLAGVPTDVALLISLGGFGVSKVWYLGGAIVFPLYRPATHEPRQHLGEVVREAGQV